MDTLKLQRQSTALSCTGLMKTYGHTPAVSGLSFTIARGQVYGLLGPNGAGKTTTLRIIAGLIKPDAGEVVINGVSLSENASAAKKALAYIPDDPLLYGKLTPLEQLEFVAGLWGMRRAEAKGRAEELLQTLGLWEKRDSFIESLSRGMKQKVAFAAAFLYSPSLILLDEPLTGLDVASIYKIKDMLRQFVHIGGTVVLTTHLLDVAERMAERLAIIDQGRLLAEGKLDELRAQTGLNGSLEDVFLLLTNSTTPSP